MKTIGSIASLPLKTTLDGLLNRRVILEQPETGYRVAIDTVLLAAAVPTNNNHKILDLGAGVGGAMLCLACRVPDVQVQGIEIQAPFVSLARSNLIRNSFAKNLTVDLGDARAAIPYKNFDCVMFNPPFHDHLRHDVSQNVSKKIAMADEEGDLYLWIKNADQVLNNEGCLVLINRADRKEEIISILNELHYFLEYRMICSRLSSSPNRIVVRAWKTKLLRQFHRTRDLILHEEDGKYSNEADAILRHMQEFEFPSIE